MTITTSLETTIPAQNQPTPLGQEELQHWAQVGIDIIAANKGIPHELDVNPLIPRVEEALGKDCWPLLKILADQL